MYGNKVKDWVILIQASQREEGATTIKSLIGFRVKPKCWKSRINVFQIKIQSEHRMKVRESV